MPTECTALEPITKGEAVCVRGWDGGAIPPRPIVAQATVENLEKSQAVFGVAQADSLGRVVQVLVAGETADNSITSLGSGKSRLIVTDYLNGTVAKQCRLKRIDDTSDGINRQERFVVGTVDQNGTVAIQPRHNSDETGFQKVYNVRAYGAVGDGTIDDAPAIQTAINAMGAGAAGATLFFPEGTYRCASDIHIYKQMLIRGVSGGAQNSLSRIVFEAGKQFIAWHDPGSPFGGVAQGWTMQQLDITSSKVTTTAWAANTLYTVRTKCIVKGQNWCYVECIKQGTSHMTTPPSVDFAPDYSAEFVPGTLYLVGQLVRGSTDQQPIAADGSNLITSVFFEVTVAGVADARPVWNPVPGQNTVIGATFKAIDSAQSWIIDNECVWAAKVHSGVWMRSRGQLDNVHIKGTTNAAVTIRGNDESPKTNTNVWYMTRVVSVQCGLGFFVSGLDASGGVAILCDVESAGYGLPGNGGIGIYDNSFSGCTWIGCQVANDPTMGGGRSYQCIAGGTQSQFINCYSESFHGDARVESLFMTPCIVVGGVHGAGVNVDSSATIIDVGDRLGMRFLTGRNVFNGPAEPLFGYLGRQDPSSVFNWASWSDAELMGIGYSTRLNSWPIGWWVFGRAMNNVKNGLAIVGEGAKWPQGETVTDEFATWIPLTRLHIGPPFGANPPSIGYGTQSPADAGSNDYYVQGSIVWNSGAMVGQPTGWMCTVTGNPGTWVAMANL